MKSALMAVAITALMGGLVVAPVTQQSAQALVSGGLKALGSTGGTPTSGTPNDRGEVILVGRSGGGGGGGHGGGGGRGGGGGGGGKASGGGHGGGKAFSGGGYGGGKAYRGGGSRGGSYAYRGGKSYGSKGRNYSHNDGKGHKGKNYSHNNKNYYNRYYRYGRYRNYGWYGGAYAYGYGGCAWLRQQALITGSAYWWQRYNSCIYY